ncbi:MAG TPA: membrane dipeptidase [Chthoniobacterales bacterium]
MKISSTEGEQDAPKRRLIDLHFDLPLGLFLQGDRRQIIATDFLPELEANGVGLLGVALFVEDQYLPDRALQVALEQVALLKGEVEATPRLMLCRTFADICEAETARRIGLLLTMEGVEPLGDDLHLLQIFYELGLRSLSLTHTRVNAAAAGAIFEASGSPATGLTSFGRALVDECERLGILLDLAHINPAGFAEICARTNKPLIVSHSNVRRFYDIERNLSDEQIRMIGARGGVIGISTMFVSPIKEEATLDRYVDHLAYVADLIGIDSVGSGFDFCEFLWQLAPPAEREFAAKRRRPHSLADLNRHAQAQNLTRKLSERGFDEEALEKILRGNWLRVLEQIL